MMPLQMLGNNTSITEPNQILVEIRELIMARSTESEASSLISQIEELDNSSIKMFGDC
jgi:hypothetical protein